LPERRLFLKADLPGRVRPREEDRTDDGRGRIRCPLCRWEPRREDRWGCTCGAIWNTFDTRGVCPDCAYRWEHTQCLRCREWSDHETWYEEPPRDLP
jgi:hypothetical protein